MIIKRQKQRITSLACLALCGAWLMTSATIAVAPAWAETSAAYTKSISDIERKLKTLRSKQDRLSKKKEGLRAKIAQNTPDTKRGKVFKNQEETVTENLAVLHQDLDRAFLMVYSAGTLQGEMAPTIFTSPDNVMTDMRNEWAAAFVAEQILERSAKAAEERKKLQAQQATHQKNEKQASRNRTKYQASLRSVRQDLQEVQGDIAGLESELASLQAQEKVASSERKAEKLQRQSSRMAQASVDRTTKKKKPKTTSRAKTKAQKFPVLGDVVMKFGQKDALGTKSRGMVFEAGTGKDVVVPRDGTIKFAGAFGKFKQLLIVEHQGGYHSLITGFDEIEKQVGDRVRAGTVVGQLAQAQAYYELRHNGVPVDPNRVSF